MANEPESFIRGEGGEIYRVVAQYSPGVAPRGADQPFTVAPTQLNPSPQPSQPFGEHVVASKLVNVYGVTVEIYPNGGVIVFMSGGITITTRPGQVKNGHLGHTQIVITPDQK